MKCCQVIVFKITCFKIFVKEKHEGQGKNDPNVIIALKLKQFLNKVSVRRSHS